GKRIISLHPGALDPLLGLYGAGWPLCLQPGLESTSVQEERARYFVKDLNMFLYKCDVERSWRINPADVPKNPIIFITGKFTVEEVKKWGQERVVDKVKEIIKMPTYSRFLCDQLWFLPQGVGDFYVRIFCERAVDFSEKLQLTIAEIGSNLSRGVSVTNYLLGNRYHPGESFRSHGAGVGKRSSKRKAAEALEEEHKQHEQHDTSPEDMLKKIAEKGLVAKDLNMKILGKCKDKFGDHGKAAVVNSYVLHERLALVTPATALFCGTAKAIGSHLD
ncbi:unnamed protein product, partial [Symbiodinium pilosum]